MIKESRSNSFAGSQTHRDSVLEAKKLSQQQTRPPISKGQLSTDQQMMRHNQQPNVQQQQQQLPPHMKKQQQQIKQNIESFKSYDSQTYQYNDSTTNDNIQEEIEPLNSQRSVRTLKSLQNERNQRKASHKKPQSSTLFNEIKGEHNDSINLNEIQFQILKVNERLSIQSNGLLNETQFRDHNSSSLVNDSLRQSYEKISNLYGKQQFHFKKASMLKGEQQSSIGRQSDHSDTIPNENERNESDKKKSSSEKKGTQHRSGGQSQMVRGPKLTTAKHFNINAVRDSSPLKTLSSYHSSGKPSISSKHQGPLSERGMFKLQPKDKPQDNSNRTKELALNNSQKNLNKQPKQGQKNKNPQIQSLKVQTSQYHSQKSPRNSVAAQIQKHTIYLTQCNKIQPKPAIESDFVNSQEEEKIESLITGQSFHLPQSQALSKTQQIFQIQGITPKINSLNVRAGPAGHIGENNQKQNTIEGMKIIEKVEEENIIVPPLCQSNEFLQFRRKLNIDTKDARQNSQQCRSNFRNESLERILGCERADSLFDQLEKIQQKDNIKLNRSILHQTTDNKDRGNGDQSQSRLTITPLQMNESSLTRKRQNTFSTQREQVSALQQVQQITQKIHGVGPSTSSNNNQSSFSQANKQQPMIKSPENRNRKQSLKLSQQEPPDEATVIDEPNNTQNTKELPYSPPNFPSSVKDKIKNITQRIKQEIQKQENDHTSGKKAGTNVDVTQSSIKSIYYKDQFKKYLNADKREALQKSKKYQDKVMNQTQEKATKSGKKKQDINQTLAKVKQEQEKSSLCQTQKQPFRKVKMLEESNKIPEYSAAAEIKDQQQNRRKQSITNQECVESGAKNEIQQRKKKASVVRERSLQRKREMFNQRRKSEIQCIIYAPNQPPEIFTSVDNSKPVEEQIDETQKKSLIEQKEFIPQKALSPKQKQQQQQPLQQQENLTNLQQMVKEKIKKIEVEKVQIIDRLSQAASSLEFASENGVDRKVQQEMSTKSGKMLEETFIKAKLNNLLKETRSKILEIDEKKNQTPRNVNSQLFQTQTGQSKTPRLNMENVYQTSKFESTFKDQPQKVLTPRENTGQMTSGKLNFDLMNSQQIQTPLYRHQMQNRSGVLQQVNIASEMNALRSSGEGYQPLGMQQLNFYAPGSSDLEKLSIDNTAQFSYPRYQEIQQQQQYGHYQNTQFNPLYQSTPYQQQNIMSQYRQSVPVPQQQHNPYMMNCQMQCQCYHHSIPQQQNLGHQIPQHQQQIYHQQMQQPQMQQQMNYPSNHTQIYQSIRSQIAQPDFFSNYIPGQMMMHQQQQLPYYHPQTQQQFYPPPQNFYQNMQNSIDLAQQLPLQSQNLIDQQQQQQMKAQYPQQQQQQLQNQHHMMTPSFSQNTFNNPAFNQLKNFTQPKSKTSSRYNSITDKAQLGLQLENALNQFDQLDDFN